MVDCLNHTAKKKLHWRTPVEVLKGSTPDISMFRYSFWQEVDYLEPTASFPKSKWKSGRLLGIAWDHGDSFTYQVWSCPDGDWKRGKLLIRDVLRPARAPLCQGAMTDAEITRYAAFDLLPRTKTRKRAGQKRKRKQKSKPTVHMTDPDATDGEDKGPNGSETEDDSYDDTPVF